MNNVQFGVSGTKRLPGTIRVHVLACPFGISEHDGGKTGLHVPEDMAMEEPDGRICLRSQCDKKVYPHTKVLGCLP